MFRKPLILIALGLILAACGSPAATQSVATPAAQPTGGASAATAAPTQSAERTKVTMAMPYVPNVQFAAFYVAKSRGYYAAEGLDVAFDYQYETDSVQRVAQGEVEFGMAGGDSVLLARAQGLPVVTVATHGQKCPTVFYSKAALGIKTPADLKGKSVGIPGRFGASYVGLLALLYANKIPEADLNVQEIGFAQVQALSEDKVQVASGYGNNEPVQLAEQGVALNIIRVADFYPLASDGIIANQKLIADQPAAVRGFVRATLRGMQDSIADPEAAFKASLDEIPELKAADAATQQLQRKVLQETLAYWQSDATAKNGLGYTDEASWSATHAFLRASGLLQADVDIKQAFSNEFIGKE